MILLNDIKINVTKFPDNTSQVWKLTSLKPNNIIKWYFEYEHETILLFQLIDLCFAEGAKIDAIVIPFVPYARQDKDISNNTTFAYHTFECLMRCMCYPHIPVYGLDIHGWTSTIKNIEPTKIIKWAINCCEADYIIFPDKGAYTRYNQLVPPEIPYIIMEKNRDQSTGHITSMVIGTKTIDNIETKSGLVIDDICDGGATFTMIAETLNVTSYNLSLYVTHGIFSKGTDRLFEYYKNIYTTDSRITTRYHDRVTQSYNLNKVIKEFLNEKDSNITN